MALGLTQPLTEMSTSYISWGVKAAGAWGWQPYHLHVLTVLISGSLNLREPSGPFQACKGIAFLYRFVVGKNYKEELGIDDSCSWQWIDDSCSWQWIDDSCSWQWIDDSCSWQCIDDSCSWQWIHDSSSWQWIKRVRNRNLFVSWGRSN